MDAAAKGQNGVIGGVFDTQYTTDGGHTFNVTKGDKFVGQSCESLKDPTDDQFFGITGHDIHNGNGVAISTNGGKTFTFKNISELNTYARYGAFPSKDVWYVSAGMFGSEGSSPLPASLELVKEISARLYLARTKEGRVIKGYRTSGRANPNDDYYDVSLYLSFYIFISHFSLLFFILLFTFSPFFALNLSFSLHFLILFLTLSLFFCTFSFFLYCLFLFSFSLSLKQSIRGSPHVYALPDIPPLHPLSPLTLLLLPIDSSP